MSESLLPLIVFIFALTLGYFVGRYISTLKHKEKAAFSAEQNNQLKLQIEDLRFGLTRSLEENKIELAQIKTEAEERLKKIKKEREEIRRRERGVGAQPNLLREIAPGLATFLVVEDAPDLLGGERRRRGRPGRRRCGN